MIGKSIDRNYCATVVEIDNIIPLEGCDNIVHTSIFGNLTIVGKDTKIGDVGLYFPVETQLSVEFARYNNLFSESSVNRDKSVSGYFGKNRRVKATTLRGYESDGFFIPMKSLDFIESSYVDKLKVGMDFQMINDIEICRKFILEVKDKGVKNSKSETKVRRDFNLVGGQFEFHYKTLNLGKKVHSISKEDIIHVSKKIHGTSGISANLLCRRKLSLPERILKFFGIKINETEYRNIYASRKIIRYDAKGHSDYRYSANQYLSSFLEKGMTVYYELAGYTEKGSCIQKGYDYGCDSGKHKIYVYRITLTNEDGYVFEYSAKQVENWCNERGILSVPCVFYGRACELTDGDNFHNELINGLKKRYLEKDCDICQNKVPAEGVVVRAETGEALKLKSFAFKKHETKSLTNGVIDEGS